MTNDTNDFGKAKGDTMILLNDIQTDIKLEEARRDGLSPLKTAEKLFGSKDAVVSFGKTIKIISAFERFYKYVPNREDVTTWKAGEGYAAIIQGYIDHPSANEFVEFHETSQTLKDVLMFILRKEEMPLDVFLTYIPRLDKSWFLAYINEQTILQYLVIAGNKEEYDFLMKKTEEDIEKSQKKVMDAEALHETLMKD